MALDPEARAQAKDELKERVYARKSKGPLASRTALWEQVAKAAGHTDPYKVSVDLLYEVTGILWKAGYQSTDQYLGAAKQVMLEQHGDLPEAFALHLRRVSRAAARGRGTSKQASELPLDRLADISCVLQPASEDGPCFPWRFVVIGCWWLLREIEAANLTLKCVEANEATAQLFLPANKTDSAAEGATRSLAAFAAAVQQAYVLCMCC